MMAPARCRRKAKPTSPWQRAPGASGVTGASSPHSNAPRPSPFAPCRPTRPPRLKRFPNPIAPIPNWLACPARPVPPLRGKPPARRWAGAARRGQASHQPNGSPRFPTPSSTRKKVAQPYNSPPCSKKLLPSAGGRGGFWSARLQHTSCLNAQPPRPTTLRPPNRTKKRNAATASGHPPRRVGVRPPWV